MVADDDPKELERSARVLENSGYRVVSATDGRTALQEALTRRVDLIIMDVSIPQLSGVEPCHWPGLFENVPRVMLLNRFTSNWWTW